MQTVSIILDENTYARLLKTAARNGVSVEECVAEAVVLLKNKGGILPLKHGRKILLTGTDEIHSGTLAFIRDAAAFTDILSADSSAENVLNILEILLRFPKQEQKYLENRLPVSAHPFQLSYPLKNSFQDLL